MDTNDCGEGVRSLVIHLEQFVSGRKYPGVREGGSVVRNGGRRGCSLMLLLLPTMLQWGYSVTMVAVGGGGYHNLGGVEYS